MIPPVNATRPVLPLDRAALDLTSRARTSGHPAHSLRTPRARSTPRKRAGFLLRRVRDHECPTTPGAGGRRRCLSAQTPEAARPAVAHRSPRGCRGEARPGLRSARRARSRTPASTSRAGLSTRSTWSDAAVADPECVEKLEGADLFAPAHIPRLPASRVDLAAPIAVPDDLSCPGLDEVISVPSRSVMCAYPTSTSSRAAVPAGGPRRSREREKERRLAVFDVTSVPTRVTRRSSRADPGRPPDVSSAVDGPQSSSTASPGRGQQHSGSPPDVGEKRIMRPPSTTPTTGRLAGSYPPPSATTTS